METFTVLGTGWLGLPLSIQFAKKYHVKVSIKDEKNKEDLISKGLVPYLLNENDFTNLDTLLDTDYLFINFPPSKFCNYLGFLEKIYSNKKISFIKKIIFISSTSIYPNTNSILTEDSLLETSISKNVFDAEMLINKQTDVIFRCSGLMGANRIAGKYFANRSLDSEDVKVNYVHRDDVIEATKFIIKNDLEGVFNLCSKEHPTRKEIYLHNAKKYNFEEPIFENKKSYKNRVVDGSKIEEKGFKYKYPNPLEY